LRPLSEGVFHDRIVNLSEPVAQLGRVALYPHRSRPEDLVNRIRETRIGVRRLFSLSAAAVVISKVTSPVHRDGPRPGTMLARQ
jgi:hypothetical protein